MSIDSSFVFTPDEIAGQRGLNRRLARMPRMGVVGPVRRVLVRTLLRLGGIGADARVARAGVRPGRIAGPGAPLSFRTLTPDGVVPRAVIVSIHGGAWAFGSPAMDDLPNAVLARTCGAVVLSPDYALALPRPIPALQRECAAALAWVLAEERFRGLPVLVAGESAGAHLALSALIALRDDGVALDRVRGALLHCGVYDLGGSPSAEAAGPDTLVLHGPGLEAGMEALMPGLDADARRDPALSPVYADLAGLPPIIAIVGDIDPLRDDSRALVRAATAAGGRAELAEIPFAPHGVMHMPGHYAAKVRRAAAAWAAARLSA